jgi:hypothetical protein
MTDPPDHDGEVPERFLELIDEILASDDFQAPPSSVSVPRAVPRPPRRVAVYAAIAAAAIALAIVGASALQDPDISSVDTERAANPPSPAISEEEVAGEGIAAQIVADAEVAARFGLTLGPRVFRDDGVFVVADQPDLTPVYDGDALVGYVRRTDIDVGDEPARFVVVGPDGATVRGVFDPRTGFVAGADPSPTQGD